MKWKRCCLTAWAVVSCSWFTTTWTTETLATVRWLLGSKNTEKRQFGTLSVGQCSVITSEKISLRKAFLLQLRDIKMTTKKSAPRIPHQWKESLALSCCSRSCVKPRDISWYHTLHWKNLGSHASATWSSHIVRSTTAKKTAQDFDHKSAWIPVIFKVHPISGRVCALRYESGSLLGRLESGRCCQAEGFLLVCVTVCHSISTSRYGYILDKWSQWPPIEASLDFFLIRCRQSSSGWLCSPPSPQGSHSAVSSH